MFDTGGVREAVAALVAAVDAAPAGVACADWVGVVDRTQRLVRRGPWRTLDDVEIATLEWVDWFNNRRIFEAIGNCPPVEIEATYYRNNEPSETLQRAEHTLH